MSQAAKGVLAVLFLVCAAYAQATQLFSVAGVNPNLTLVLIIIYSFFIRENAVLFLFSLLAALLLSPQPRMNGELLGFLVILTAAIGFKRYLRWQPYVSASVLVAGATMALVLVLNPQLFLTHPRIIIAEVAYHIALANIFLGALMQFKK